ncbi:3-oxoacyl-ACP reductase [Aerococcus sp. L_32]|uniref:3-oxoacyl-ACP reductase n=1 Tax=Aerococcus sp. L_32 TaxID=3422316 RepID=UPI003D6A1EC9
MTNKYTDFPKLPNQLNVVITGAMSGIGASQVEAFLSHGHRVYTVDIQTNADQLAKWQAIYPETYYFQELDCSDVSAVSSFFQHITKDLSGIDVLCNTAGKLDGYVALGDTNPDLWADILTHNLQSVFNMTKAALPYLLANPTSRLINMASIAGLTAGGGGIAYTTAKHAIVGFTKQMAFDYAGQGLVANAIAPGAIMTPMNQADFVGDSPMADQVMAQTPAKRWAGPDEVAALTLFLASDQAAYMQGNTIPVDGGWLIR